MEEDEEQYSYLLEWDRNHPVDYFRIAAIGISIILLCGLVIFKFLGVFRWTI